MAPLVLLLGPMASGKTSLCTLLFQTMADRSMNPYAIIQENRRSPQGYPVELSLVELPGGEKRFLGVREGFSGTGPFDDTAGTALKPFAFDHSAFAWASAKLEQALAEGRGILILDEIGPLELQKGEGLMPALEKAARAETLTLVLSLRPNLEKQLLRCLPNLVSRRLLRIYLGQHRDENELFFTVSDIIRHCQDTK